MDADREKEFKPLLVPENLLHAARALRRGMTDAEQSLWYCLRRKQVAGFRFRRQHPFEKYVLDFYCPEARLAVELDGGQHNETAAAAQDMERTTFLNSHGIKMVRVWNHEVFNNLEGVLQMILVALLERVDVSYGRKPPP